LRTPYVGKNDLLFKKVFADQRYAHILKGLIQDIYQIQVDSIHIETPYNIETFYELNNKKLAFTEVDVVARLSNKSVITIEMQVQRQKYYLERALYYLVTQYASNYGQPRHYPVEVGDEQQAKYRSLYPVYGLSILDFSLDEQTMSSDSLKHYDFCDLENQNYLKNRKIRPSHLLKLSFFELTRNPPFRQQHLMHWINYFTKGTVEGTAPDYIQDACQIIAYQNLEQEERNMIDIIEKAREDRKSAYAFYKDEGRKEGREEQTNLIAKKLFKEGLSLESIQRITGLTEMELHSLRSNYH